MKKIVTFMLLFFMSKAFVFSQAVNNDETKSLLNRSVVGKWGGYGSIEAKYSNVHEDNIMYLGLKGAAISNRYMAFGVAFGGFMSSSKFEGPNRIGLERNLELSMGYGGVFLEYIGLSTRKVHFSIPVLVGIGGGLLMEESEINAGLSDESMVEATSFVVIEPGVNLEVNILSEVRLFVGPSYRLISNNHFDRLTNEELTGFSLNFGIKVGSF